MGTLITMVGLPGSGKSTFANTMAQRHGDSTIVVSTDSIRKELFGSEDVQAHGDKVFALAYKRIEEGLAHGYDVVFDATNLTKRARKDIFKLFPIVEHLAIYVSTPVEVCKERNANRSRVVPEEVINKMANKLTPPSTEEGFGTIVEIQF